MSEETHKSGDWTEADLDLVVGDYFVMLAKQLAGQPFNPASHQRALRFVTGRPGGAIEFRQRNISAALTLIGIPILKDFAPRWKLHDELIDAVDRQLSSRPTLIAAAMRPPVLFSAREPLHLVEGPPPAFDAEQLQPSPRAERLIAKFDPAGRDFANSLPAAPPSWPSSSAACATAAAPTSPSRCAWPRPRTTPPATTSSASSPRARSG